MMAGTQQQVKLGKDLPSKEAALFKTILKFYEHKQYKKGLKTAEQILKKFPAHGETLAMKGLFCSHLDRRDEAHELIKKGLMSDMRSHICWHVYGLLHRSEKNYEEAAKCYSHALKYDKDNMQIMRDYALLQIQMRNYEAFNETRHQLLKLRPGLKMHWMGLAVSYHLLKQYDSAEKIITAWEDSMKDTPEGKAVDFDNSELLLYKNMIIEESGDVERALTHLRSIHSRVLDKKSWKEARARLLLKLGRNEEAAGEYRELFADNPDNVFYLESLKKSLGLTSADSEDQIRKLKDLYQELHAEYPRSQVVTRMPLSYLSATEFYEFIKSYLVSQLRKGVPSLFSSFKHVLADVEKQNVIEKVVLELYQNLKTTGTFDGKHDSQKELPTSLLWTLYFIAKLNDFKKNYVAALKYIDEALEQSPTVVELLMAKARIYKHAGDPNLAMNFMNQARMLDLQDRFVNSKCVKYMLQNNATKEAEETIALFARHENQDFMQDLVEMQCMWFATAYGKAQFRLGNYGKALKRFHQIEKHFVDIYDDQFDFHSYCLRKMTLRAYVDLIRVEDKLRSHPFYVTAATSAIRTYLLLFDGPPESLNKNDDQSNLENMSPEERKKALRKAKKAALKSQNQVATNPSQKNEGGDSNSKNNNTKASKDSDPDGVKLIEGVDYLEAATKFVKPLNDLSPSFLEGWILASQIYQRKKKFLLALRAIKKAKALAPQDPQVHSELAQLVLAYLSGPELDPVVLGIFKSDLESLFEDKKIPSKDGLAKLNQEFLKNNSSCVRSLLAVAQVILALDSTNTKEALAILQKSHSTSSQDLQAFISIHQFLANRMKDSVAAKHFKEQASSRFPLASYFKKAQ